MNTIKKRQMAIEAVRIINNFVGDLVVSMQCIDEKQIDKLELKDRLVRDTYRRMCYAFLLITLTKWCEVYRRYKSVLPIGCKSECKELTKTIEQRRIPDFRNNYIGHIWDKELKRPLLFEEIDKHLIDIGLDDEIGFLKWVNDPSNNTFPNTVVSVVEYVRDQLINDFALSDADLFVQNTYAG